MVVISNDQLISAVLNPILHSNSITIINLNKRNKTAMTYHPVFSLYSGRLHHPRAGIKYTDLAQLGAAQAAPQLRPDITVSARALT